MSLFDIDQIFTVCLVFSFLSALGSGGGEEDQVPGCSAGGDPDEEARDQAEALRGARDHHGSRERSRKLCFEKDDGTVLIIEFQLVYFTFTPCTLSKSSQLAS